MTSPSNGPAHRRQKAVETHQKPDFRVKKSGFTSFQSCRKTFSETRRNSSEAVESRQNARRSPKSPILAHQKPSIVVKTCQKPSKIVAPHFKSIGIKNLVFTSKTSNGPACRPPKASKLVKSFKLQVSWSLE